MRAAVIENGIVVNVVVVADWYAGNCPWPSGTATTAPVFSETANG